MTYGNYVSDRATGTIAYRLAVDMEKPKNLFQKKRKEEIFSYAFVEKWKAQQAANFIFGFMAVFLTADVVLICWSIKYSLSI